MKYLRHEKHKEKPPAIADGLSMKGENLNVPTSKKGYKQNYCAARLRS